MCLLQIICNHLQTRRNVHVHNYHRPFLMLIYRQRPIILERVYSDIYIYIDIDHWQKQDNSIALHKLSKQDLLWEFTDLLISPPMQFLV